MSPEEITAAVVPLMKAILGPVVDRLSAVETAQAATRATIEQATTLVVLRELVPVRDRLTVLETRPPLPGPPGQDGIHGKDGAPGPPGPAGLEYRDVYQAGQTYVRGQVVTYAGSAWHCNRDTGQRPGDGSADWTLMVKRGRDARGAP